MRFSAKKTATHVEILTRQNAEFPWQTHSLVPYGGHKRIIAALAGEGLFVKSREFVFMREADHSELTRIADEWKRRYAPRVYDAEQVTA